MTPYDKANDVDLDEAKPRPTDPGEPEPRPSDPGDERILELRKLIARQQNRISELEDALSSYQAREEAIVDLIQRTRRQEAYARLHQQVNQVPIYPEGLGGVGQCDCTMSRSDAIQQAIQTLRGT